MNHSQAINQLSRFHPQLFTAADYLEESSTTLRVFNLQDGEKITIRGFSDDNSLYALKGHATLCTEKGEEYELVAGEATNQRYLISNNKSWVQVTSVGELLLYQVDVSELDYLVAWHEMLNLLDPEDPVARKRAELVRNSRAFHRLPIETLALAISRLKNQLVMAGEEVIRQGDPGDVYYIIEEGKAEVWETGIYDDEPKKVNELFKGDAFGEEALVLGGSRSATVRMITDGSLLALDKQDFNELISKQMIHWVDAVTAKVLIDRGHTMLDVRYEEEHEDSSIPGSLLVPLQRLRQRYQELDPDESYVTYCKGGKRSAVACLLLQQHHYDVVSLSGGIRDWPYEVIGS